MRGLYIFALPNMSTAIIIIIIFMENIAFSPKVFIIFYSFLIQELYTSVLWKSDLVVA